MRFARLCPVLCLCAHLGAQTLPSTRPTDASAPPLTLPSLARGWRLQRAEVVPGGGREGRAAVRLAPYAGRDRKEAPAAELVVDSPPSNVRLEFGCWLLTEGSGALGISLTGEDAAGKQLARQAQHLETTQGEWRRITVARAFEPLCARLLLRIAASSSRDVLVCDPELRALEAESARPGSLEEPGVVLASAGTLVRLAEGKERGTVTFPIPGTYRDQVPVAFWLEVLPKDALRSARWVPREDQRNVLCQVDVAPGPSGAAVRWKALVLVAGNGPVALPKARAPEVPAEAAPWLASTACVQADDPAIQKLGARLAEQAADVESYVRAAAAFTRDNKGDGSEKLTTLDAMQALACGGSCTSRANLCAALLRARGIPARTLAHLPLFSEQLYEHWLVEYWHPGRGWVWVESTMGVMQPWSSSLVVLNVANPEDEDRSSARRSRTRWSCSGRPTLRCTGTPRSSCPGPAFACPPASLG